VFILFCSLAFSLSAGVYDDVVTWWHFDYDADSDNIVQTNEVRDQVFWGSGAAPSPSGAVCTYRTGPDGGPTWTNIIVAAPLGGVNYGGMSVDFAPLTNAANNVYPESLQFPQYNKVGGSCTLVTRLLSRGYVSTAEPTSWVFNNNFDYANSRGWLFGIHNNRIGTFNRATGISNIDMNNHTFVNNKWYDIAIVFTDNGATGDTVEFYAWPQGDRLKYYKYTHNNGDMIRDVPLFNGAFIGGESFPEEYLSGNARKAFNGYINHFALWDRALTMNEILDAFSYPNNAMQIGLDNDSSSEFGDSSVQTSATAEGEPWHTFDSTVSTGDPVEVVFPLNSTHIHQRYTDQYMIADVLSTVGGSEAKVALIVNSTTNAARRAVAGIKMKWLVDSSQFVDGDNTLKLLLTDGPATSVNLDSLFLGGSWNIGKVDGDQTDFVQENIDNPDDFYYFDPNWKHVERAVTTGDTNIVARFWIPDELVGRADYIYSTRIILQGGTAPPHPFAINLNDNLVYSDTTGVPNNTVISVEIPEKSLLPGENQIRFMFDIANHEGGGAWLQFDYHRLEIVPHDPGTLIILL